MNNYYIVYGAVGAIKH